MILRQSIGSTWILQLVIIFMLIFVGFLALTINYTKAFKMKNEIVSMIEKYEGISSSEHGSISLINNYLRYYNYHTKGVCEEGYYGINDLNSSSVSPANGKNKYYYCVRKVNASDPTFITRANYEVVTFFQFNLPVIGDFFTFRVNGKTIDINKPTDDIPIIYK